MASSRLIDAERLGGDEVDDEVELGGLLNRDVAGAYFAPLECPEIASPTSGAIFHGSWPLRTIPCSVRS